MVFFVASPETSSQPHFSYKCATWYPNLSKKYRNKLQVLQNKWACSLKTDIYVPNTKTMKNVCWDKLLTICHFSVKFHTAMCYNTSDKTASKIRFSNSS